MDYLFEITANGDKRKFKIKNCVSVADGKSKAIRLFNSLFDSFTIDNFRDVTESKEKKYDLPEGWQDIFGDILK